MVTNFNSKDLVSFGNYVLSNERKETIHKDSNSNVVYHSDVENWKENERKKVNEKNIIDDMDSMCIESLNPDEFEKWQNIKKSLISTRVKLK